ncbi:ABC transporter ATP-binding protein [Micromonospora sediminimaris]|uniref:ABC transporter ATP-binding protein n=1 Tax=Micromonospora sediminimaris TaxID=547162 RepID=UPI0037ACDB92
MSPTLTERVRGWTRPTRERWSAIFRLLPRAGASVIIAAVLLNLAIGVLPMAFIIWTGQVLGDLPAVAGGTPDAWRTVVLSLTIAVAAFVFQQMLVPFQSALGEVVIRRVDGFCAGRLGRAALAEAPIAVLERPDISGLLGEARGGYDRVLPTPGDAVAGALALIARYSQLAGAVILVGFVLSVPAALLIGATALIVRYGQRGSLGRFGALWVSLLSSRQRVMYLRSFGTSTKVAKEMRMFGLLEWYQRRHRDDSRAYLDPLWVGRRRILLRPFLAYAAVALVGGATVLYWLAGAAGSGTLTLTQLGIAIQGVLIPIRFGVFFPESDVQTQYGMQAYQALTTFERTAAEGRAGVAGDLPVPAGPIGPIRFDDVAFRYGEKGSPVLDGVSCTLPAGRSTAIVGLNGAGKTTLVKLLARLYDPTGGAISVGGVDLRQYSPRDWQQRLAVIFQDYVHYELDAAANIGLGAADHLDDREGLLAAARRAGAEDVIDALPHGLDTILSRQYAGGTDLSGGQWQRIALARALFAVRHGASVLVLDEPTAQLDVRAEVEFYDRFLELTRGLTTVIISHRFSTVRRADQIIVLDGGRVTEQGSHDELMAAGGQYAELFRLQARRFSGDDEPLVEVTA